MFLSSIEVHKKVNCCPWLQIRHRNNNILAICKLCPNRVVNPNFFLIRFWMFSPYCWVQLVSNLHLRDYRVQACLSMLLTHQLVTELNWLTSFRTFCPSQPAGRPKSGQPKHLKTALRFTEALRLTVIDSRT